MAKRELPVKENEELVADITGITHKGEGVAKFKGYPLFIKGAMQGETVRLKVVQTKKNFGYGKLLEVVNESEHRVEPRCSLYKECGGCNVQHISYEQQLANKTDLVVDNLKRIGHLEVDVNPCIGMEDPWRYRNKTQVPFGLTEAGEVVAGFYKPRSHDIVNMERCDIQDDTADEIIDRIRQLSAEYDIEPYNEFKHKGFLRHVIVRKGHATNEYMVTLITNKKRFLQKEPFVDVLSSEFKMIKSIVQNVNTKKTNVILGDETLVLYGQEYIYDYIGDVKFAISARSFYQINPVQTKVLYEKALEYANLTKEDTLIDAYCGIGTIALFAANRVKKVYGVEVVKDAIKDAKYNAELNGFKNTHFELGKAEVVIPDWRKQGIEANALIVDPPRKGCDESLLNTIIEMQIPRMVYVSCNPATLARDLRILEDGGYAIREVQPVDMFPHTSHVECVVSMVCEGK
ncbi:23S rRNA (uracil(1939)-C(5))-methyltransferase RlmD [Haloplasma contractile]|uniref:23S rRNA -methyltransferase RlmCD protein n=1 Tax=Haloplasma contractile SSD-17B TaxID=1033810 RepID=U2E966_9MOLU|nr:23S rRNA (uracil(1939)-C(5))-methyltransferase RlmD [Haloplasma contractile]ERJ11411.1 23S rRNA -methyltransferase RlmCD protein [Haloplasma contractile SSD-17B]